MSILAREVPEPEGTAARISTAARGGDIQPEGTRARIGGDPMGNTIVGAQVEPIVVGPSGDPLIDRLP
jgi:hypothetical protein